MIRKLAGLPRNAKSVLLLASDFLLLPAALWTAIGLRLDDWSFLQLEPWWIYFLSPVVAIPIFVRMGLYRAAIRYMEERAFLTIAAAVTFAVLLFSGILPLMLLEPVPRGALFIFWLMAIVYISISRFMIRTMLRRLLRGGLLKPHVLIYGAGSAGRQFAVAMQAGQEFEPVAFVDDDLRQQGVQVGGLRVYGPERLPSLIARLNIEQVLLAIPSASRNRRIEIINKLEPLEVKVRAVPGIMDMVSGSVQLAEVRDIDVDELLGRPPVPPIDDLLAADIRGKVILVSGAGGSIGSELCRQILSRNPSRLILLEQSEVALYSIDSELRRVATHGSLKTEIFGVLGSVCNRIRVEALMNRFSVNTVYHAAAYKHVPIVEFNASEGVINNTFGTRTMAEAAIAAKVQTFVLVSTDKAVRPTNVMGASKRMAELVLQAYAQQPSTPTRFTMVRFGNVLESSGSVVPLFRQQINAGGPLTVTHAEITRYFMTIPEAAQLVIQAGAMAKGGDVFVLDMGQPVKIVDLARRMIHLSGFSIKDSSSPNGDIEIRITGLRPGEKLYEELLIDDNVIGTEHPLIMRAEESSLPLDVLSGPLQALEEACAANDRDGIIMLLRQCVSGFKPESGGRDVLEDSGAVQRLSC